MSRDEIIDVGVDVELTCNDDGGQSDPPDAHELAEALRRRILCALPPAIDKLAAAARGERVFGDDHELRSCVALARLAPALLGAPPPAPPPPRPGSIYDPEWWTPERRELLRNLDEARGA